MAESVLFAYEAQTQDGQVFKGSLEGRTPEEVTARLGGLSLRVLSVVPEKEAGTGIRRPATLGADDFLIFNQQLAHLTQAGLPVERGLRLIAIDLRSGRLSKAANEVAAELEHGVPLKEAFAKHASRFPPLYGKLVDAGVSAGNLPGVLFNLGRHLELVGRLRRSLWQLFTYPLVVMAALSLVLLLLSMYVIPTFEEIFKDFRTALPLLTELMFGFSHIYPIVFAVIWSAALLLVAAGIVVRLSGWRGISWENLLVGVPVIGGVLRANILARWIDALKLGIQGGLDLPRAVALATDATSDRVLRHDAAVLTDLMTRGHPLSAFQGSVIPATVPAAIELAASAGDLPGALATLSQMYEEQAEHQLRLMPAILSPLMIVLMGGAIGLCVLAMFLPLVKLIQSVSGG